MYNLPKKGFNWIILVVAISVASGLLSGGIMSFIFYSRISEGLNSSVIISDTNQEQFVIKAVKETSPAVVSIIISKDVPVFEQFFYKPFQGFDFPGGEIVIPQYRQKGTLRQEVGGGTGVIVSEDGIIVTNKHVVSEEDAEYTVFTNDGKKFSATVLARDPVHDLAIIKIDQKEMNTNESGEIVIEKFPIAKLGNSDDLQIGQTVIAIGNALGEFKNTVSVGVISGLSRTVTASGEGIVEVLEDIIQTDAAINKGNSGGPLLNLKGEVIGINTAMAAGAQSIGFAIPVNKIKRDIDQVKEFGEIIYPFLGVRYFIVNDAVKEDNNLPVDYGAIIARGEGGEPAIVKGSAADNAGLKEADVILEINGERITTDNTLSDIIIKYNPGDKVTLKILRPDSESTYKDVDREFEELELEADLTKRE